MLLYVWLSMSTHIWHFTFLNLFVYYPFPRIWFYKWMTVIPVGEWLAVVSQSPFFFRWLSVGSETDAGTESKCEFVAFYLLDCLQFFNHTFDLYPKEWCYCLCPWTYALYFKRRLLFFFLHVHIFIWYLSRSVVEHDISDVTCHSLIRLILIQWITFYLRYNPPYSWAKDRKNQQRFFQLCPLNHHFESVISVIFGYTYSISITCYNPCRK